MSCNTESWPRSGVSVPSAKTTDPKLQAETECSRFIYTIRPLYAGERLYPQSPESEHFHEIEAKRRPIHYVIERTGFKIRVADTELESRYGLDKEIVVIYVPVYGNPLQTTPVL